MQKADQLDEMEQNLEPNDRRYTFKIDQPNKAEHKLETERLKEVGDTLEDDQLDDEQISAKLVTPAPSSEDLEQVNTETCNNVKEKQGAIQMQVLPPKFVCQSDVASISTENLQEALTTADSARDETFNNLKYKMETSDPLEIKKLFGKHDDPDFDTKKTKFAHPEDDEEAVYRDLIRNLPQPQIDTSLLKSIVFHTFDPLLTIIDQIANGTPPTPHVSMRYELLRFCTLRSYPKENKPYLIKLAEAGFYYASDGDGVVCYCCGVRRYNWVAEDIPMKIHQRINPNCKFLRKNDEVNVPVQYFGPNSKDLMAIMDIPEPREKAEQSEDVNNDWAPERTRSPAPSHQNRQNEAGVNSLRINNAMPRHTQYATKAAREGSYSGWPDEASRTPQELSDAGFFYAGFGDCVRCFYCGIGLRHWTKDDNPWIEHARWSRNCVFVKQKKGEEFVNIVQLAVQYSQDDEAQSSSSAGNQLPAQEIERILLSDAAQSVLEMGYQPRIIKKAIEQILSQNENANITTQILMEKVLEIEEIESPPLSTPDRPVPSVRTHSAKPLPKTANSEATKATDRIASISGEGKTNDKDAKASVENKGKTDWLTDKEINRAQTLLKDQFPRVDGLQDVLLFEIHQFHTHENEFVQIYNANKNHWVVISSIGQKAGTVALYDSFSREISKDTSMVISHLTNLESVHVIMPETQIQTNSSDCGLFSIAFATAILNGVDVSSLNLDPELLGFHLAKCFSQDRMELFPEIKNLLPRLPAVAFEILKRQN